MRIVTGELTSAGGRQANQDRVGVTRNGELACCLLADGLGGHGGGERAAELALGAIDQAFRAYAEFSPEALRTYLEAANRVVEQGQRESPQLAAMRTTLVMLLLSGGEALWAHVGDSRLYHFQRGRIALRTKDHSVPQAMADAGQIEDTQIRFHEDRNRLLKSLGGKSDIGVSIVTEPRKLSAGDAFLLASDGLWEHVNELEMEAELAKADSPAAWLAGLELRLLQRAQADHDNYSAVAVMVEEGV